MCGIIFPNKGWRDLTSNLLVFETTAMLLKALRGQHCHWAHGSRLIPLVHWKQNTWALQKACQPIKPEETSCCTCATCRNINGWSSQQKFSSSLCDCSPQDPGEPRCLWGTATPEMLQLTGYKPQTNTPIHRSLWGGGAFHHNIRSVSEAKNNRCADSRLIRRPRAHPDNNRRVSKPKDLRRRRRFLV